MTVANNGSGISEEDQNKLFKPFSKLKDTKKINPNGNGLGLNICKMLCRKLGGDITVSSRPNEWTEFTFWVNVKICEDCDIIDAISSRPAMQVRDLPKSQTKSALTVKTFLAQPERFGALLNGKKYSIICADDVYYNIEALRIVF